MHLRDRGLVALYTIFLGNVGVKPANADWFGKVAGGKGNAVIKTVDAFDHPFVWEAVGGVTVVTGCNGLVARMAPALILVAHNMAVDTRSRVVGQIREAFGIAKGK